MNTPVEKNSYLFMGTKRIAKDSREIIKKLLRTVPKNPLDPPGYITTISENNYLAYYYTDHLGSTRAIQKGSKLTKMDYAPFGEDFNPNGGGYKFSGKEDDVSTGLYYFNARYYDPAAGRFITEDPAKDGGNWYLYCGNNPLRYVDVDGMEKLLATNKYKHIFTKEELRKPSIQKIVYNVIKNIILGKVTGGAGVVINTAVDVAQDSISNAIDHGINLEPSDTLVKEGQLYQLGSNDYLEKKDYLKGISIPKEASYMIVTNTTLTKGNLRYTDNQLSYLESVYFYSCKKGYVKRVGDDDPIYSKITKLELYDIFDMKFSQGFWHGDSNIAEPENRTRNESDITW